MIHRSPCLLLWHKTFQMFGLMINSFLAGRCCQSVEFYLYKVNSEPLAFPHLHTSSKHLQWSSWDAHFFCGIESVIIPVIISPNLECDVSNATLVLRLVWCSSGRLSSSASWHQPSVVASMALQFQWCASLLWTLYTCIAILVLE